MNLSKRLRRTKDFRAAELARSTTIEDPLPQPTKEIKVPNAPSFGFRMAVVPDAQVREGVVTDHLPAAGKYIAEKQPEVVLCIGDWWDMPSLSQWAQPGSLEKEGQRYRKDIDAGCDAMERFLEPIAKKAGYKPLMVFTEGNHEDRIDRAIRRNPNELYGVISKKDMRLEEYGWKVIPYLQPVVMGGVSFCHFFPSGVMGRPITSPRAMLQKLHMSCFAGHQQGREIAYARRADGGALTAIISGSFYQHDEPYMSPLANRHWRGMWVLSEIRDGQFDEMALSIDYLKRKYK